jgi:asparagine synthase (glutamine-hydrolysing)
VDLWCVELSRTREAFAPVLGELWDNRSANPLLRQGADHKSVAVVTDGSRWSDPVRLISTGDPRHAHRLLIVDAPFARSNFCLAVQASIDARVKAGHQRDVAHIASELAQVLGPEFAVALIDMDAQNVVLIRDPIGARPLYWRRNQHTVAFASSRDRLIAWGPAPSIDESAVAINLASGKDVWRSSELLTGFHRVPHGGYTSLSQGDVKSGQWWAPSLSSGSSPTNDRAETARQIRGVVEQAVASRLGETQTVGAHVSGGIDSTGVAAIGARRLAAADRALVAGYAWSPAVGEAFPDMGWRDERRRIDLFAAKENVSTRFGGASAQEMVSFLERPMELEGTADLSDEIPILRLAQSDGVQIMLSGWGGDEVFSSHGFGYLSHLLITFQWDRAVRWIRAHLRTLRKIGPLATYLWWQGLHPLLPDFLYRLLDPYGITDANRSLISPALLGQHRDQVQELRHAFRVTSRPHETMFRHFMVGHITHRMESWDVWSRQHGFRYTYPLTDWRLIETLLSLTPEQHFPDETPRGLAMESLADALPAGVTKFDAANEASRAATRLVAWQTLAELERKGRFQGNCPWLDMKRFRENVANPTEQTSTAGILQFYEVFKAVRVWHMWSRQEGLVAHG